MPAFHRRVLYVPHVSLRNLAYPSVHFLALHGMHDYENAQAHCLSSFLDTHCSAAAFSVWSFGC